MFAAPCCPPAGDETRKYGDPLTPRLWVEPVRMRRCPRTCRELVRQRRTDCVYALPSSSPHRLEPPCSAARACVPPALRPTGAVLRVRGDMSLGCRCLSEAIPASTCCGDLELRHRRHAPPLHGIRRRSCFRQVDGDRRAHHLLHIAKRALAFRASDLRQLPPMIPSDLRLRRSRRARSLGSRCGARRVCASITRSAASNCPLVSRPDESLELAGVPVGWIRRDGV